MSSVVKRILNNVFYIFSSQVLVCIINAVFIIFSARLLGAKAYGVFALVNTMILITSPLTNLGIRAMVIRRISKDKANAEILVSNILVLKFFLAITVYILLILFVNIYSYSDEIKDLLYIAGIVVVFNVFVYSFESVMIAYERMKACGLISVISTFIFTAVAVSVLAGGHSLREVFLVKIFVAAIFALVSGGFVWKKLLRFRPRLNFSILKDIIILSFPFFIALLLNVLNAKIDIIMLSVLDAPVEKALAIGYYAPANTILLAIMILPKSLNRAMLPMVSQKIYKEHETVRKSVEKATKFIMITISFPIIIATTFFSREIIALLFGSEYVPGASALMILGWAYAFNALNIPSHSVLGSSKELKAIIPLLIGIFLVNMFLNYLLIPKYSYIGAAFATSFVMVVGFVGRFYFLRKILEVKVFELFVYLKLLILLGITVGCGYFLRPFVPSTILLFLIVTVYLALLFVFKVFEREEVGLVKGWVGKKLKF